MTPPAFLTQADDTDVILASLPVLAAVAYGTNKFMSAPDWGRKGTIMVVAGVAVLAFCGLFSSACEGSVAGACKHAPKAGW